MIQRLVNRQMGRILIAWFFIAQSGHASLIGGTKTVIGPFATEAQCHQMREWVMARGGGFDKWSEPSWCWWDGRQP